MISRAGSARYEAVGKEGNWPITTQLGVLCNQKYDFGSRFGINADNRPRPVFVALSNQDFAAHSEHLVHRVRTFDLVAACFGQERDLARLAAGNFDAPVPDEAAMIGLDVGRGEEFRGGEIMTAPGRVDEPQHGRSSSL